MQRREFVSFVLARGFACTTACSVAGCGTLLHPERRAHSHSNRIDKRVAALDALGLILFFVPGVVAFAVDFYTGAIFLPLEHSYPEYGTNSQNSSPGPPPPVSAQSSVDNMQHQITWQQLGLKRVVIPPEQLTSGQIEKLVTDHIGKPVSIAQSKSRMSIFPQIAQFAEQISYHRANPKFGNLARSFTRSGV